MKFTKRERTQHEIIQAAKNIIYDKGYEGITVRYLAEITGYSHTNLYYYFRDLSSLLWALRIEMIEDMIAELNLIPYAKEDSVEEILEIFLNYIDYFFKHPNIFRFFYFYTFVEPNGDDSNLRLEERFRSMWKNTFFRLIQEGIIQTEDIEIIAKTIIYSIQGMIMLSLSSNGTLSQEDIKTELAILVNYLLKK